MNGKATTKTIREIIQDLFSNDPRSKNQQVWTLEKKKKKEDKHQYAGFLEKYNMKMKIPSPLKDFMSLMNRISFQKQGFIFVRSNNAYKDTTLDQFKTTGQNQS